MKRLFLLMFSSLLVLPIMSQSPEYNIWDIVERWSKDNDYIPESMDIRPEPPRVSEKDDTIIDLTPGMAIIKDDVRVTDLNHTISLSDTMQIYTFQWWAPHAYKHMLVALRGKYHIVNFEQSEQDIRSAIYDIVTDLQLDDQQQRQLNIMADSIEKRNERQSGDVKIYQ